MSKIVLDFGYGLYIIPPKIGERSLSAVCESLNGLGMKIKDQVEEITIQPLVGYPDHLSIQAQLTDPVLSKDMVNCKFKTKLCVFPYTREDILYRIIKDDLSNCILTAIRSRVEYFNHKARAWSDLLVKDL